MIKIKKTWVFTIFKALKIDIFQRIFKCFIMTPQVHNLINRKRIKKAKEFIQNTQLTEFEKRIVNELKTDGISFTHISDIHDLKLLEDMQKRFNKLKEEKKVLVNNKEDRTTAKKFWVVLLKKLTFTDQYDPFIVFMRSSIFYKIMIHYLGLLPRFIGLTAIISTPENKEERKYSQNWHRDYSDIKKVKIFIYLNDITEMDGPFEYIKQSHLQGELGSKKNLSLKSQYASNASFGEYIDDTLMEEFLESHNKKDNHIVCTAKAGTIIFADTYGFHRGGFNKEGNREVLIYDFFTEACLNTPSFEIEKSFTTNSEIEKNILGLK